MKSRQSGPNPLYYALSFPDTLWRVFVSLRLTITLLLSLTALSVAGTLIAQQGQTQVPIESLYAPQTLKWLVRLGLTDIFHSAFFVALLLMLAMNLLACSIERLPKVWRDAFHVAPPPVDDPTLREWTPEIARIRKYLLERPGNAGVLSVREARAASELFFQKYFKGYTVLRDAEDQFQLMVEKGKYSRVGVYITHLSLLMIMFGGAAGAIWGVEGAMSIEEGTRVSWMQHNKGSNGGMNTMHENGAPVPGFLSLGFDVECEKFTLETYDGSRPKAFRSKLKFYENDVLVHQADIEVNHPTVYKGMTFYQASFNETGVGGVDLKVFRVDSKVTSSLFRSSIDRKPSQVSAQVVAPDGGTNQAVLGGKPLTNDSNSQVKKDSQPSLPSSQAPSQVPSMIPGGSMPKVTSVELVENVHVGDLYRVDGDAAFRVLQVEQNLMDLGPAAKIQYFPSRAAKKSQEFWIFKNLPGFDFAHRRGAPLNFVLENLRPKFATGLSVARDPGVWVVWIGCLILVGALFMALYTCHSRYWVAYTQETGFVVVGWSNKLFLFEPRYERFFKAFKEEFKV